MKLQRPARAWAIEVPGNYPSVTTDAGTARGWYEAGLDVIPLVEPRGHSRYPFVDIGKHAAYTIFILLAAVFGALMVLILTGEPELRLVAMLPALPFIGCLWVIYGLWKRIMKGVKY